MLLLSWLCIDDTNAPPSNSWRTGIDECACSAVRLSAAADAWDFPIAMSNEPQRFSSPLLTWNATEPTRVPAHIGKLLLLFESARKTRSRVQPILNGCNLVSGTISRRCHFSVGRILVNDFPLASSKFSLFFRNVEP